MCQDRKFSAKLHVPRDVEIEMHVCRAKLKPVINSVSSTEPPKSPKARAHPVTRWL